jgi:hypothetical protein
MTFKLKDMFLAKENFFFCSKYKKELVSRKVLLFLTNGFTMLLAGLIFIIVTC